MPSEKSLSLKSRSVKSKKAALKKAKPQRPFYKSPNFIAKKINSLQRPQERFMQWVCSPDNQCYAMETPPFTENVYWRIFRIMAEFIEGFEFLSKLQKEVTFFGSARTPKGTRFYKAAEELGRLCAKSGLTVITGGGPGIMEAGNKGAYDGGGESIGLDIELPTEQRRNDYVTRAMGFHYFFTRKVMLSASAQAYVFFPGGFGTLDEATEMITLIQTGKIPRNVPCIFIGKSYWKPFFDWISQELFEKNAYINKQDMDIVQIVDSPKEAFAIINKTKERPL